MTMECATDPTRTPPEGRAAARPIFLVGMMGVGKTTIGRQLAAALGREFIDLDQAIEARCGVGIATIFDIEGEAGFRRRETAALDEYTRRPGLVLATGGGAVLSEANRRMITEQGVAVCLEAPLDVLWQRVRHKETRPLLRTPDPRATLAALYEARAPIYALADLRVRSDGAVSIDQMVERVLAALATRPDVLAEA